MQTIAANKIKGGMFCFSEMQKAFEYAL